MFKLLIIGLLFTVIISLGTALFHLSKSDGNSGELLKALTWRIGLSVAIFIILLIGQALGFIQPHGLV